jgi:ribosomal protein S18 acetylase RimI-like enzyme
MIRKAVERDVSAIAELHTLILPDSIFVKLGRYFLERYYHTMLTNVEHVFSYVYEYDGKVVGFIAMATSHELFYRQIRKDSLPLAMTLMRSVFTSAGSFSAIIRALSFLGRKDELIQCDAEGELLQIAVHPDYRVRGQDGKSTDFFKRTNARIAQSLFLKAMEDLKARSVKDYRIMTGDDNAASNRFYAKLGCLKVASGIKIFNHPTSVYKGTVGGSLDILRHSGV